MSHTNGEPPDTVSIPASGVVYVAERRPARRATRPSPPPTRPPRGAGTPRARQLLGPADDRRRERHHRRRQHHPYGRRAARPGRQQLRPGQAPVLPVEQPGLQQRHHHRQTSSATAAAASTAPARSEPAIDAAILAINHSFIVDHYDCGATLGTLTVNGAISQKFRGAVGTFSGGSAVTGYLKNYNYDDRLRYHGAAALPRPGRSPPGTSSARRSTSRSAPTRAALKRSPAAEPRLATMRWPAIAVPARSSAALILGSFVERRRPPCAARRVVRRPALALPDLRRARSPPTTTSRCSPGWCCGAAAAAAARRSRRAIRSPSSRWRPSSPPRRSSSATTPAELALGLVFCALLVAVTLTDLERQVIPNAILLVGAAIGRRDRRRHRSRQPARARDRGRGGGRLPALLRARLPARDGNGRRQARGGDGPLPRPGGGAGPADRVLRRGRRRAWP